MLRITCPYCGERDYVEFGYGGDAENTMPELSDTDIDRWADYVFFRNDPKGEHAEFWQHQHGCRQWLRGGPQHGHPRGDLGAAGQ